MQKVRTPMLHSLYTGTLKMAQNGTERWRELCARAALEEDVEKLHQLIAEILVLFDAREERQAGIGPLFSE
jgi:hypothetical protein